MRALTPVPSALDELLYSHDGVLDIGSLLAHLSPDAICWRVKSGRWQRPCRGIVVAQSGPLTHVQMLRVATLWAGPGAALGGLTAARLQGFRGFADNDDIVHVIRPAGRRARATRPPLRIVVHYSRRLTAADVHPARQPAQTRIARSLIDAAAWMATDRGAQGVLASGVQQRLVRVADLTREVDLNARLRRRRLIKTTLTDIAGGAHALSELDFISLVVRQFRLPAPDQQVPRRDENGRRRWLDVCWDRARLVVEIDGAAHMDAFTYWDDMARSNDLALDHYQVLRFPAWMVRYHPEYVATKIRKALRDAGYRC
jgi:Protein of unknown function (DUF559)